MQFEEGEKVIDFLLKIKIIANKPEELKLFPKEIFKSDLLEHYLTCIMSLVV